MTEPLRAAFARVVAKVGTQDKLGRLLGKRQSTVSYWAKQGVIPAEEAVRLEAATDGHIPRWESRPDLWAAPEEGVAIAPSSSPFREVAP